MATNDILSRSDASSSATLTDADGVPLPSGDYLIDGKKIRVVSTTSQSPTAAPQGALHSEHHINWGGVIKGVAIVAAVVAVGAVGYLAVNALVGTALTSASVSSAAATASSYAGQAGAYASGFLSESMQMAGTALSSLATHLGLTGGAALTAAAVTSTTHAAALVGGGVAVAAAAPTAVHALNNLDLSHTTVVATPADGNAHLQETGLLTSLQSHGSGLLNAHTFHDLTHISHHAVEHASPSPHAAPAGQGEIADAPDDDDARKAMRTTAHATNSWINRTGSAHNTGYASHADAVRAQQSAKAPILPRDANFASQLDADRAQLEGVLAK